jgi:predicted MFS family arabinose efflux permease
MDNFVKWAKAAGIRAIRTVAQAALAGISTAAVIGDVDWRYVLSAAALAGVLSLLTSVAGLPELRGGSADLPEAEVLDGIDVEDLTDDQLRAVLVQLGLSRTYTDGLTRPQLLAALDNLADQETE